MPHRLRSPTGFTSGLCCTCSRTVRSTDKLPYTGSRPVRWTDALRYTCSRTVRSTYTLRRAPAGRFAELRFALVLTLAAGCAAGNDELGGGGLTASAATSGGSTSSMASSSNASTGSGGTAGEGGTGGVAQGGGGVGGAGGQGGAGAGGSGGQGGGTGTLLLVGTSGTSVFAAHFAAGPATWTTSSLTDASDDPPGVAITTNNAGLALIRSTSNGGELRFAMWNNGSWTSFSAVAPFVTTRARPSVAASDSIDVAFQGDDFKHYFAGYQGAWTPTAEPIGGASQQSFGPSPPVAVVLGSSVVVAFAGDNGDLYDETRASGAWQPAAAHGLGNVVSVTPALVPLTQGPELMLVYARKSDSKLSWTTRTSGAWTTPVEIDGAFSGDAPSLAPGAGGAAALAFRGLDGKVYTARYTPGAATPWSAPAPVATPNFGTPSSPALASGVGGDDAELAFVDAATGGAFHSRLMGSTWSTPAQVGGTGLVGLALASGP